MSNRLFNSVQTRRPKRNAFDLSYDRKLSFNPGDLVPILLEEIVPGDKFRVNTEMLLRFAPLVAPIMHRVNVYTHFFFVPNRLVYEGWETFITGGPTGKEFVNFPQMSITDANKHLHQKGSLTDYFGLPIPPAEGPMALSGAAFNALPFRAYHLIWNEYFRDQNLSEPTAITKDNIVSGTENNLLPILKKRAYEKDYFTSALPWLQRGDAVILPTDINYKDISQAILSNDTLPVVGAPLLGQQDGNFRNIQDANNASMRIENLEDVGININDLRTSVRLQEWLEKNARGGARYIEQILSHFGVKSSNQLLQRPQYLGGGKNPVVISEVLSTFNNETVPGANMYGHGISAGTTNAFKRTFEEHGFIIGLMSVLPRTAYQQGISNIWDKFDKFLYFWPEFANLGEQAVLNKEVFFDYNDLDYNKTFGYQSRYAEYKFNYSSVHGDFRDTLDHWHWGRKFAGKPSLNEEFVTANPDPRIFAVTDPAEHKLYAHLYNHIKAIRPMPVYGTPTL